MTAWTVDSLNAHIQQQLADLRLQLDERHIAQLTAIGKAEAAADKRFDSVNEFRLVLTDQQARLLTRVEYATAHETLTGQINTHTVAIEKINAHAGGLVAGWSYLVAAIGMIIAIVSLIFYLVYHNAAPATSKTTTGAVAVSVYYGDDAPGSSLPRRPGASTTGVLP